MRNSPFVAILMLTIALLLQTVVAEEAKVQTTCPVTGHAIDRNAYEDYNGKRIYFCCESCIEEFRKTPEEYMKRLEAEGIVLEDAPKAQINCPVKGGAVNKSIYSDYEGKRVYFCCEGCQGEFAKDPGKYIEKLEADGVVLERVSETSSDKKDCGPCPMRKSCRSGGSA
jgi:YHS domain-containing protein